MIRLAVATLAVLVALPAAAADWTPRTWANANTVELRTTNPGEAEHWFPVWLVILDDQVYVRLGSRAAGRIEKNTTAPYVGVRIAGQQFDRVKAVSTPESVERVARAMGEKYWSDVLVRYANHPLTMRLVVE